MFHPVEILDATTRHNKDAAEEREAIFASGAPLATTTGSGQIGWLHFDAQSIETTLYPGGLIVKPPFMSARAIPLGQIKNVVVRDNSWSRGVEILHDMGDFHSRTFLDCHMDEPFRQALHDWFARNQVSTVQ